MDLPFFKRAAKKSGSIALIILCSLIIFRVVQRFCEQQTEGFTWTSVRSHRDFNPEFEVHALSDEEKRELDYALSQEYSYFARGSQAFVFLSEDGEYVIKFLRQKFFGPPFALHLAPKWLQSLYPERKMKKRMEKLHRDFLSYKIAFDELREETGLVLVHLNKSSCLKKVDITDKLGIKHHVDLNQMDFILQKKADLVYPILIKLIENDEMEKAKLAVTHLLELLSSRCKKGIADSIPDWDKNFGFLDLKAVQIDIGKFSKDPSLLPASHKAYISKNRKKSETAVGAPYIREEFKAWLWSLSPELCDHFNEEYARLVKEGAFALENSPN